MASQGPPPPPREGLDLATLLISAVASAAAAYVTSRIWAPGTLFSAAFTPVIVAFVKEGLRKPTEVITSAVPTPSRWTRAGADDAGLVAEVDEPAPPPDASPAIVVPTGKTSAVKVYSTRGRRLRWRLAVITGLLGFAIAVVAFTVPELIAGQSIGGSHKTTIFGGRHGHHRTSTTSTTGTPTTSTTSTTETTGTTRRTTIDEEPSTARPAPTQATPSTTAPSTAAPSTTAPAPSSATPSSSTPTP